MEAVRSDDAEWSYYHKRRLLSYGNSKSMESGARSSLGLYNGITDQVQSAHLLWLSNRVAATVSLNVQPERLA